MIEKFTFDIEAPRVSKKIILVKNDSESRDHVVMKLLAYVLFYHSRLKVEPTLPNMHYKPDLAIENENALPDIWIDCGYVSLKKVETLSKKLRSTRFVLMKKSESELKRFRAMVDKKVEWAERVEYLAFESGFVEGISENLLKNNQFTLYEVMEEVIGVVINDTLFESKLIK